MKLKLFITAILISVIGFGHANAQKAAVKTDILSDVILSPSISVEVAVAEKWTAELAGRINAWTINEHNWKHWLLQPEVRYWFCQRFSGNFVGAHLLGGQYNFGNLHNNIKFLGTDFSKFTDERHQGWYGGAGIAYGHSWILDRHWNIEAEIGIGWVYTHYDVYRCADCGKKIRSNQHHNYFGPTKAAINLIYTF